MLACRIHAKEDLRIEAVDTPEVGPGQVLLRLGAGGICGSDLHYYFEGRNGSFVVREPLIPGHEASVAPLEVVMEIGPANAASAEAQQYLPGTDVGHIDRLDPQIVLGVNSASKHVSSPMFSAAYSSPC